MVDQVSTDVSSEVTRCLDYTDVSAQPSLAGVQCALAPLLAASGKCCDGAQQAPGASPQDAWVAEGSPESGESPGDRESPRRGPQRPKEPAPDA